MGVSVKEIILGANAVDGAEGVLEALAAVGVGGEVSPSR